ncbi:hypothetical protein A9W99_24855 [Mycobacterium sp. 1164966.3]|nr:hypothetical protein [Mycobacterium sp. 1164966.3]OBA78344.1 hypothetical protein A9W99_24855 [Mycobacterium sp. 1164966.3]
MAKALFNAGQSGDDAKSKFEEALRHFEAAWNHQNGDHPINDAAEVERARQSLHLQADQLPKIAIDLENIAGILAEAQGLAAGQIATLGSRLRHIDDLLDQVRDIEQHMPLTPAERSELDAKYSTYEHEAISDTRNAVSQLESIRTKYSDTLQSSLTTLHTNGYDPQIIQTVDVPGAPSRAEPETNRQKNQIHTFTKVFGHPPQSPADWETAAALDPHSYDPKNGGVPPNISIERITPVPGQGVVRTNLFIPGESVVNPQFDWPGYHDNLGDNRDFSATAGPESSRVAITVDYENGIIVTRQNPSVDAKTGQIRAGTPSVSAIQKSDGSVLIKYSAADPFSPGGEAVAKATTFDVNGTIAIAPTESGPVAGGIVTNFPAVEIYSDRAGETTPLVQAWPRVEDGRLGPLLGLEWHKEIGDQEVLSRFGDQWPALQVPVIPSLPVPGLPGLPNPFPSFPIPLPRPIRIPLP